MFVSIGIVWWIVGLRRSYYPGLAYLAY